MVDAYRAVLVGLGNIAWKFGSEDNGSSLSHAAAITRNPQMQLVAGCSPDCSDREAFKQAYGLPVFSRVEEMLSETKPDLVSICSPTADHYLQVRECLRKRIPMIWLEKPPAETAGQLEELIELQEEEDGYSRISVNFQRRYMDSYHHLRQALVKRRIGVARLVEIRYSRGLLTNGSHLLDMLFFVMGETDYELLWIERNGDKENPSFSLRLGNGCMVIVSGMQLPYHNIDFSVTCDGGRISILHNDMTPKVESCVEHELFPGFYRLQDQGVDFLGDGGASFSFDKALANLIDSHESGGVPVSNLRTALPGQELLEQVLDGVGR